MIAPDSRSQPSTTDIVWRLRQSRWHGTPFSKDAFEAADRIEELETALREMIQTQDDWEIAVAKIIGRQPEIFTRAIDRARAALPQSSGVARQPSNPESK